MRTFYFDRDFPEIKGSLPHYSLGDLGLIPRPNQHIPTSMDKLKVSSKQNKLGTLRGVLSKSVATQTSSGANVSRPTIFSLIALAEIMSKCFSASVLCTRC